LSPPLRESTAASIVQIVQHSKTPVSFGQILVEASLRGVLSWHRTLRRYLDLLVQGQVLKVREKDVGSVNPQQLYTFQESKARLWTGLEALALAVHGLNWDVPSNDLYPVLTDLAALVRSTPSSNREGTKLVVGLEDGLAYELKRDMEQGIGGTELVAALLATRPVDLAYLVRRSDLLGIGGSTRRLFEKISDTYSSIPGDVDGRVFLQTRERFLKNLHLYTTRGSVRLLKSPAKRDQGTGIIDRLSPATIVSAAGKQLGVTG
jgi:hypothetical protein